MKTLLDMIQEAQGGQFQQNIANQFGLDPSQAEKAIEALMPAFSRGLKQNAADPMGFAKFMGAVSTGKHEKFADDNQEAFSNTGINEGNAILGHLFGSKDVSKAVAANASALTGIGETLMKQILPALAPVVMGALFKNMSGQTQASQFGGMGNNPLGQIFEQMTGAAKRGGANPLEDLFGQMMGGGQGGGSNPIGDILGQMMGGGQKTPQRNEQQSQPGKSPLEEIFGQFTGSNSQQGQAPASIPGLDDNPLGKIFGDMMRGGIPGGAGNARQKPEESRYEDDYVEEAPQSRNGSGGLGDLFGEMFETGRTVQKDYQRGIDDIFDQYLDGMNKK